MTKRFGSAVALDCVSLEVRPGEIHALVGENGSGKSTLCRVLFGDPVIAETDGFEGRVLLDGEPVSVPGPIEALALGIGLVHQELALIPGMTVAENIALGVEPVSGRLPWAPVDTAAMRARAEQILARLGATVEPDRLVDDLPIGARQLVEAAREADRTALKTLILDEPSAALSASEAASLGTMMRSLAADGVGVLLVTHRLPEVVELADRITVLRDGRVVATLARGEADTFELARLMVGRDGDESVRTPGIPAGAPVLEIEELAVALPGDALAGLSLSVRGGEIVGVTAQSGHGRLAIAAGLLGLYHVSGRVVVDGRRLTPGDPVSLENGRLAIVSENRRDVGLALRESVALNIGFPSLVAGRRFVRAGHAPSGGLIDRAELESVAADLVARFDVRCDSVRQAVGELSGGNQQKVAIARAVAAGPRALVVAEPTRGIDVAAKEIVLRSLAGIATEGVAIVVVSGEVAELERLCDRIVVLRDGRAASEFRPPYDRVAIELAVIGEKAAAS
ncbi:MAG: sugar ABC transporter ATP-binding protein [Coriobacteriia bacterium]|nr:sugar ABC transporter ATP-binding protein [Coriobacteriia bacterium]